MNKFKLPTKSDLKSRTSTINNAFAISITPWVTPSKQQVDALYKNLQIKEGQCAYCLREATTTDHIYPLVYNGLPTGYITDIRNLAPCCSRCNSSKGGKSFSSWYLSDKNIHRLHLIGLSDDQINERYRIIDNYIKNIPEPLNYKEILGEELWGKYIDLIKMFNDNLKTNQKFCNELRDIIKSKIDN